MKVCSKCKTEKDLSSFRKDATRKDGYEYVCKNCGRQKDKNRYWSDADKQRQRGIEYYWRDPEDRKQKANQRRRENAEYYRAIGRQDYAKNPEKYRGKTQNWRKLNHTKVIAYNGKRRSEKLMAAPSWLSAIQRAQIQEFYDIAKAKTMQTGVKHHVDHIHPLKGNGFNGLHVPWNLRVTTAKENLTKYNALPDFEAHLEWSN